MNDPAALTPADESRRERALNRSLVTARAKAEERLQRFLDAAYEIMAATPGREFTVQDVVDRSGQSLGLFYQYFAGKHELQLALFEQGIGNAAERVLAAVATEHDALGRLHRFAIEYHRLCQREADTPATPSRAVGVFAQRLIGTHPEEAARAFAPMVDLIDELLLECVEAGVVRTDLDRRHLAGVLLGAIMSDVFSARISGSAWREPSDDPAEELWAFLLDGLRPLDE